MQELSTLSIIKFTQSQTSTAEDTKYLNKALKKLNKTKDQGIKFQKLHRDYAKIMFLADDSFNRNSDHTSQLGYILHYGQTPTV